MARKKTTQKQKQKQSQKVIVNVGGGGRGRSGNKAVHHHHHHSINQVLTDASSTHAVNNASNALLGHISNMTKAFESRDAEREANAVRLSYGVNPTPGFIRGFNRPAQPPASSGAERDAIAKADAPNDNLISSSTRLPVARGYKRIVNAEPAEVSNSPAPIQVPVSKRLIEDEADLALNGLSSLQNPTDMTTNVPFQDNPMMATTGFRPNVGAGGLTIEISQSDKRTKSQFPQFELPYVIVNGKEMSGLSLKNNKTYTKEQIRAANSTVADLLQEYDTTTRAKHTEKVKLMRSQSADSTAVKGQGIGESQVALINKSKALKLRKSSGGDVAQNKQAGGGGAMRENKGDGGGFG